MKKTLLYILLTCITSFSFSQIHEVGVFVGGSTFIGDIGNTRYINPDKFSIGLVYKRNLNPRIALRGNYFYFGFSENDIESDDIYRKARKLSFNNTVHELGVGSEFNFFSYNIRNDDMSFTPYILTEVALINYTYPKEEINGKVMFESTFNLAIPVGLGIKGRLNERLAYALESSIRFTFKDDLDFSTNTIKSLDYGRNGNDFYLFTGISIVYTFGQPPCYNE